MSAAPPSFTIYGLRVLGDSGVRYIGQTAYSLDKRMRGHETEAKAQHIKSALAQWIIDNRGSIEPFPIYTATTRSGAHEKERLAVECALALGHELFNQWLVPPSRRVARRPGTITIPIFTGRLPSQEAVS